MLLISLKVSYRYLFEEGLWGNGSCVKESLYALVTPFMFAFIFFASNIYMMTIFFRYHRSIFYFRRLI
eukprot:UN04465